MRKSTVKAHLRPQQDAPISIRSYGVFNNVQSLAPAAEQASIYSSTQTFNFK